MPDETENMETGNAETPEVQPTSGASETPTTSGGTTPPANTKTSATSVALTATFDFTQSRKYNFDVTGAASIEATLKSVPPPPGLVEFLQKAITPNT